MHPHIWILDQKYVIIIISAFSLSFFVFGNIIGSFVSFHIYILITRSFIRFFCVFNSFLLFFNNYLLNRYTNFAVPRYQWCGYLRISYISFKNRWREKTQNQLCMLYFVGISNERDGNSSKMPHKSQWSFILQPNHRRTLGGIIWCGLV